MDTLEKVCREVLPYWREIGLFVLLGWVVLCVLAWDTYKKGKEGNDVVIDKKRGEELRTTFEDKVVDFVEDLYASGKINAGERSLYYKWAGNSMGLSGLLPRGEQSVCQSSVLKTKISSGQLLASMTKR